MNDDELTILYESDRALEPINTRNSDTSGKTI